MSYLTRILEIGKDNKSSFLIGTDKLLMHDAATLPSLCRSKGCNRIPFQKIAKSFATFLDKLRHEVSATIFTILALYATALALPLGGTTGIS